MINTRAHGAPDARKRPVIWQFVDTSGFGGIESHIATLSTALKRRRLGVKVVFLKDHGTPHNLHGALEREGIPFVTADGPLNFVRLLSRERPAVLHSHGYKANVIGRLAATAVGVRSVSTFHAGDPGEGVMRLYTALDENTSFLSRRIAVSRDVAGRVPFKSAVIDNFLADLPDPSGDTRRGVAFIGRLSQEKGADRFCALARDLADTAGEPFHIYGDGPMRADLEHRWPEPVFHGAVADAAKKIAGHRLVVMPSRAEGLPMAALEAMGAGVPVVAARVGGLPDLITHGSDGWLVDAGDRAGLARSVQAALDLDRETYQAVCLKARQTIARRYSADVQVPRILSLYGPALSCAATVPPTTEMCDG